MNFRPRDSRVISVSSSFDRFLTYCLRDSMALKKRFLSLIFLRSFLLWFLAALLSLWFAFPFPLLLRSLIRNKSKIHFVLHTIGLQFTLSSLLTLFFLAGDCVFWWDVCLVFLYYSLQYSCKIYTVRVYEACLLIGLRAFSDISPALLREPVPLSFWSSLSRS